MGFFRRIFGRKPKNTKYEMGLHKTRQALDNLSDILQSKEKIDQELFDAIEDIFIQADVGVDTVLYFVEELKKEINVKKITDPTELSEIIVDKLFEIYLKDEVIITDLNYRKDETNVYLFVGVNGVGKTTSIGKIADQARREGHKVLVIAGDTFRAGAIEQLKIWAERAKVEFFAKEQFSDPSSVIYDGLEKAKKEKFDVVLVDTAGRLQTKTNLMNELSKMHRVIERSIGNEVSETLLVIDATTGQNGLDKLKYLKKQLM